MAQHKERADELVYAQGLAESRERAKRLIMAGQVALAPAPSFPSACLSDRPGPLHSTRPAAPPSADRPESLPHLVKVDKPGHKYSVDTRFILTGIERFVSRGAYKLLTALTCFGLDVRNLVCLDAGASTGGFTDCLLQHGAARVYAVDVGREQLHEKLRADPRVVSLEGVNLRLAPPDLVSEPVDLVVADVSFISLTRVLPPCMQWLKPEGKVVALIKPQFELGPHQTHKGVVRDPQLRQQAVDEVVAFCRVNLSLDCAGVVPSAIRGPKGNQEYLACLQRIPNEQPGPAHTGTAVDEA